MRIVIAPDSFKGTLTAAQACDAIAEGCRRALPDAELHLLPIADGGEGTARTLATATGGTLHPVTVSGPLGKPVEASFAVLGDGCTATVEMAEAAGLLRLPPGAPREPLRATTYGVGELIRAAATHPGVTKLIIALGGSATTDGGVGVLAALGVELYDPAGAALFPEEDGVQDLYQTGQVLLNRAERFPATAIEIACDVTNPLLGRNGAARIFGPQKGATLEQIKILDDALQKFADAMTAATGRDVRDVPGAGAAGGTAAGMLWLFPQATLRPGIEIVLDAVGFDDVVRGADILFTGEGRFDSQTAGGKAVFGVASRAKQINPAIHVHVLAGMVTPEVTPVFLRRLGIDGATPMVSETTTQEEALRKAYATLAGIAERASRKIYDEIMVRQTRDAVG
ncbi:MAG: glycerate kinase [Akkermansiaceae bacterium]|nr:glycerate kinase [Armatimonadota bacterium]